uniref:hypothetical protein n=1 Tax=Thiolapillus sp. TaxID=2017437 RepID=UPI003AF4FC09
FLHKHCVSCLEDRMHCVPKRPVISSLNDLRPVALTSAVMKVCERVVLCKLDSLVVKDYIDLLQFAYRRNRSTNDVVLYVLENIYSHLEKAGSSIRLMFFDFSSAINTTTLTGSETFKHEIAIICRFLDLCLSYK